MVKEVQVVHSSNYAFRGLWHLHPLKLSQLKSAVRLQAERGDKHTHVAFS